MSDDDGKVVEFRDRKAETEGDEPVLTIEHHPRHRSQRCRHRRYAVNDFDRRIYCRECGDAMDPFEVLKAYASEGERLRWEQRAIAEAEKLIAWGTKRKLRIRWYRDRVTVSALGLTGQRVECSTTNSHGGYYPMLAKALDELKRRVERWADRELHYPRYTVEKSSGSLRIGILGRDGSWSWIGTAQSQQEGREIIETHAREHGYDPIVETRPKSLWRLR